MQLKEATLARHVRKAVDAAPALGPEARARIASLLGCGDVVDTTSTPETRVRVAPPLRGGGDRDG